MKLFSINPIVTKIDEDGRLIIKIKDYDSTYCVSEMVNDERRNDEAYLMNLIARLTSFLTVKVNTEAIKYIENIKKMREQE